MKKMMTLKQECFFCRQIALIISTGVPLIHALQGVSRNCNTLMQEEMKRVAIDIESGMSLSESLGQKGSAFSKLTALMVKTGEETGELARIMEDLASYYEKEYDFRQKIKSASIYPLIVILMGLLMLIFFLFFVIPSFGKVIIGSGAEVNYFLKITLAIVDILKAYYYIILPILMYLIYMLVDSYKKGQIELKWNLLLKIPIFEKAKKDLISMEFTRMLNLCIETGFPIIQGLDHISNTMRDEESKLAVKDILLGVQKGENISSNLGKKEVFPDLLVQMIQVGEETGNLEKITKDMTLFYERETSLNISRIISLIEPTLILVVGGFVAFMIISLGVPIFTLFDKL